MDGKGIAVWMDASCTATGVAMEINGTVIEGACWLRPTNNAQHINLAELDAAFKRVNLALQWEATVLHLATDLSCVHRWISDTLTEKAYVNTKAAGEMHIRGTVRNSANAGERIWISHQYKTHEILSEPCRQSHQSTAGYAQGRKRASARELRNSRTTGWGPGGWHPSSKWTSRCETNFIFCQVG